MSAGLNLHDDKIEIVEIHIMTNCNKGFFLKRWSWLLVLVLFMLMPNAFAENNSSLNAKETNKKHIGVNWTLTNLAGRNITLSNYQGKPVILVFWATWCPYCKKLLPGMQALHEKYQAKGLTIIAVNIKEDWQPDVYWRNHGYEFDAVLEGDEIAETYGINGTPGIVFIAPSGEVLKVAHFSDPNHPSLEKFAQHFLK